MTRAKGQCRQGCRVSSSGASPSPGCLKRGTDSEPEVQPRPIGLRGKQIVCVCVWANVSPSAVHHLFSLFFMHGGWWGRLAMVTCLRKRKEKKRSKDICLGYRTAGRCESCMSRLNGNFFHLRQACFLVCSRIIHSLSLCSYCNLTHPASRRTVARRRLIDTTPYAQSHLICLCIPAHLAWIFRELASWAMGRQGLHGQISPLSPLSPLPIAYQQAGSSIGRDEGPSPDLRVFLGAELIGGELISTCWSFGVIFVKEIKIRITRGRVIFKKEKRGMKKPRIKVLNQSRIQSPSFVKPPPLFCVLDMCHQPDDSC